MDLGLAGRTVLVTGGSSGVGLATVRALLDEAPASPPAGATPNGSPKPPHAWAPDPTGCSRGRATSATRLPYGTSRRRPWRTSAAGSTDWSTTRASPV